MNEYGIVRVFELDKLLKAIADADNDRVDLFAFIRELQSIERSRILLKGLSIKPSVFGISIDLRECLKYIQRLRRDVASSQA